MQGRRGDRCREHVFGRDRDHDRDRVCMPVRSKNIVLCRQRDFIGAYGIFNNRVKYVDIYEIYADLLIAE